MDVIDGADAIRSAAIDCQGKFNGILIHIFPALSDPLFGRRGRGFRRGGFLTVDLQRRCVFEGGGHRRTRRGVRSQNIVVHLDLVFQDNTLPGVQGADIPGETFIL